MSHAYMPQDQILELGRRWAAQPLPGWSGHRHHLGTLRTPTFLPGADDRCLPVRVGAGWIRARTGSTLNTLVMHVLSDSLLLVLALVTIGVTPR
jgi:hypothetical protein